MTQCDIKSMLLPQLQAWAKEKALPAFRAGQIFEWVNKKGVSSFSEMTNLPLALRSELEQSFYFATAEPLRHLVSQKDGTEKFLLRFNDQEMAECVFMRYKYGNSLCISTQVGCKMGCDFCASAIAGFRRNLTAGEMLSELACAEQATGAAVSNLVLMGIGEPLDNYESVVQMLHILRDEKGRNLSPRSVTLSTCGLADQIDRLSGEGLPITLSVSLHAVTDSERNKIMPVNRRYPIADLMAACARYTKKTGRRVSFEYALINGVNDSPGHAQQLAQLLRGGLYHVNLIPINRVNERAYREADDKARRGFFDILQKNHISVTIRRTLGADINAACGQLRRDSLKGEMTVD